MAGNGTDAELAWEATEFEGLAHFLLASKPSKIGTQPCLFRGLDHPELETCLRQKNPQ